MTHMPAARNHLAMFAPFVVAFAIFVWGLIFGNTKFGAGNNIVFLLAALSIVVGLVVGAVGLLRAHAVPRLLRIVLGLLYAPTALVSGLMAGF
jgi:hypothetical protein